jgi:hypothetical protein
VLSATQELFLTNIIVLFAERGLPPSKKEVQAWAQRTATKNGTRSIEDASLRVWLDHYAARVLRHHRISIVERQRRSSGQRRGAPYSSQG